MHLRWALLFYGMTIAASSFLFGPVEARAAEQSSSSISVAGGSAQASGDPSCMDDLITRATAEIALQEYAKKNGYKWYMLAPAGKFGIKALFARNFVKGTVLLDFVDLPLPLKGDIVAGSPR